MSIINWETQASTLKILKIANKIILVIRKSLKIYSSIQFNHKIVFAKMQGENMKIRYQSSIFYKIKIILFNLSRIKKARMLMLKYKMSVNSLNKR